MGIAAKRHSASSFGSEAGSIVRSDNTINCPAPARCRLPGVSQSMLNAVPYRAFFFEDRHGKSLRSLEMRCGV